MQLLSSSSSFCVQPLTVAVVYKMRILAWGSLLAVVAGLANIPRAELDIKQILSSVMYSCPTPSAMCGVVANKTSSFLTDRLNCATPFVRWNRCTLLFQDCRDGSGHGAYNDTLLSFFCCLLETRPTGSHGTPQQY